MKLAFLLLLAFISAVHAESHKAKADPSMLPVEDVPGLPRVLLIGDSISIGYTVPVRESLKGKANVHRPPTNCSSSGNGLTHLKTWLGEKKWDVIHFNFGLHDAKLPPEGIRHATPEKYEANLRQLVQQLRVTDAKLIFATTTPVPNGGIISPTRRFGSVEEYNAVALRVMKESGVLINDLNTLITPHLAKVQKPNDVHYTSEGSAILGKQVAEKIAEALK